MAGDFGVQDFINGVAFGRGVEQTLIDIALEDPVYLAIMEKRHRFYMEFVERMLEACEGRIDVVLCGDDFGSQKGALISPASFDRLFSAKKKELFDLVHFLGAKVSHHCCGSSVELIPRFIENNMDALQTIQPQAHGMNPYELKRDFGEINRLMDEVGQNGGFILGPCHNIQPDTPMENVLALYSAVAKRRT
jgi:uroporphyrinogen decarboxylase